MQLNIIKCHGSGNDFIMLEEEELTTFSSEKRAQLARILSDRKGEFGSDGILIAGKKPGDGKMIMYNVDGTEAEMCGNGIRCVARKLFESSSKDKLDIQTKGGIVTCTREKPVSAGVFTVSARISPVKFNAPEVPIEYGLPQVINTLVPELDSKAKFSALSIPNPHLISIVPEIDEQKLVRWGEKVLELINIFPNGINVSMVKLLGKNHIYVKTYERGCGLTGACGTAISSSSCVSCLLQVCDYGQLIKIHSPGGVSFCKVEKEGDDYVLLTGNATYLYKATLEFDKEKFQIQKIVAKEDLPEETKSYELLNSQNPRI